MVRTVNSKRAGVKDEPKSSADGLRHRRDITLNQSHLDSGFTHSFVRSIEGLLNKVDARHLPSSPGQFDAPDSAPGPDVQSTAKRNLVTLLLPREQFGGLPDKRRIVCRILPGMEAE